MNESEREKVVRVAERAPDTTALGRETVSFVTICDLVYYLNKFFSHLAFREPAHLPSSSSKNVTKLFM